MRSKWNKELIHAEALKYKYRGTFKDGSHKAYCAASRWGWLDEVCSHMEAKRISWTKEAIRAEALKYEFRVDFSEGSNKAYCAARKRDILNDVCSHMESKRFLWDGKSLQKEALKYNNIGDFISNSWGAYQAAQTRGILDEVCSHMDYTPQISWTKEMAHIEALKYEGRHAFEKGSNKAYCAASRWGWLDEVCSHMEYKDSVTDNDTVYLWKMKHSKRKYKLGVSSWGLYHQRIIRVAKAHNTDYEILAMVQVKDAINIETELLNTYLAKPKNIKKIDGHTEFRVLNDTEVREILEYLYQEAIDIDGKDFRFDLIGMAA